MTEPGIGSRGTRFVAVLLPETQKILDDRNYYGPMIQGLNDALMAGHVFMRPIQCLHEYQKESFLSSPERLYSGVVFLGPLYRFELFIRAVVERLAGPKVLLDHHLEGLGIHSVCEDSAAGMRLVTGHLLGLGHRHVAYLDMSTPQANPWKRQGVDEALRAAGAPALGPGWVAGCRDNFSDVAAALDWFLELKPRPTAVIAASDSRALLLLQAAAERGLRVPQDLAITGYGDTAVRTGRSAILTSVWVDPAAMGRRAAELVLGPAEAPPEYVKIPPELAVRGSTAAPAEGGRR